MGDGSYLFPGIFRARAVRIVDGDTVDLVVDLGFYLTMSGRFRLDGIDAPEMRGDEKEQGLLAKYRLIELLTWWGDVSPPAWPLRIVTRHDPDNFGRFLAKIFVPSEAGEIEVGTTLVTEGLAKLWE